LMLPVQRALSGSSSRPTRRVQACCPLPSADARQSVKGCQQGQHEPLHSNSTYAAVVHIPAVLAQVAE
jgi:hypothetical protein